MLRLIAVVLLALWTVLHPSTILARDIDFTNDIMPIFTKFGCNSGGCHGKQTGRGGFKLSLFGFQPAADYDAVTRGSRGRRVFPAAPDQSLLLLKPVMAVAHGGGKRLERESPQYQLLRRWIADNTPWGKADAPRITQLIMEPKTLHMSPRVQKQFRVIAVYSDGGRRNVTSLARLRSVDSSIADVNPQGLLQVQQKTGETAMIALYQGQTAVSRVLVPHQKVTKQTQRRFAEFPARNFIDRHILVKLKQLGVPPAPLADDATFLRRATLQIAGRLPRREETEAFLDSDPNNSPHPHKRDALIDRLLASGDYADYFAQKWCDVLRIKRRGQKDRIAGTKAFHRWARSALADNMPYDQFVRRIITATGNVSKNPPVQWYAEVRYLERYVDDLAQVFLGTRIGCARCHHHPFEKFSQEDYFGLAAFFGRVARKGGTGVAERRANETIYLKPKGDVKHPLTGETVAPRGLGGPPLAIPTSQDPRHRLVDWMVEENNPYFARALVNRLWAHFFGRGLVEPMDDLRDTNPAVNEPLLDALAEQFQRSGFDLKHLVRLICSSTTYQLDSHADDGNLDHEFLDETHNHSRFYPQRLTAEVLLDAIDQATGMKTRFSGLPPTTRAVQLPDEDYSNQFLRLFGRPPRESACECERTSQPSLSQSLFVMNNRFLLQKVTAKDGYAARLAKDPRDHQQKLRELFLTVFIREPRPFEINAALAYLQSESNPTTAYGNLLWALVNTKEFMFVH